MVTGFEAIPRGSSSGSSSSSSSSSRGEYIHKNDIYNDNDK